MNITKLIDSFSGDYDFLSNFHPSPVLLDGIEYPTVEHAYQAAKTLDKEQRKAIQLAETPGKAKKLGQKVDIREEWELIKLLVMSNLLIQKFDVPGLHSLLIATGDAKLVEGNWWHDTYWGVCDGKGKNHLGKLLMQIRDNSLMLS